MKCPKCNGTGYLSVYQHVAAGVCFQCNGQGHVAGNGKRQRLMLKHVIGTLPGLTRKQTFIVYDLTYTDARLVCDEPIADCEKLVAAGYLERQSARKITYSSAKVRSELDWSLISWDK